jgi:peptide/nickel transport system substrate-binding protein
MTSSETKNREKLEWMAREARQGRMSRREFIQLGLAAGLTAALADAAFKEAVAAAPKKAAAFAWG